MNRSTVTLFLVLSTSALLGKEDMIGSMEVNEPVGSVAVRIGSVLQTCTQDESGNLACEPEVENIHEDLSVFEYGSGSGGACTWRLPTLAEGDPIFYACWQTYAHSPEFLNVSVFIWGTDPTFATGGYVTINIASVPYLGINSKRQSSFQSIQTLSVELFKYLPPHSSSPFNRYHFHLSGLHAPPQPSVPWPEFLQFTNLDPLPEN